MQIKVTGPIHSPQKPGDVGYDLECVEVVAQSEEGAIIRTGVRVELPDDVYALVLPRSSTLPRYGLHVATGTIDSGYRGEIKITVAAVGPGERALNQGDRIAQLVFLPAIRPELEQVDDMAETERGGDGFGSTGH